MFSNLFDVCKKAEDTQKIIRHACRDCIYFSNNKLIICAVHPLIEDRANASESNNCKDWKLNN